MAKSVKGASMPKNNLTPYGVGLMRLHEASISSDNFDSEDIVLIGKRSLQRRKVVLGKVGNMWAVRGNSALQELKYEALHQRAAIFRPYYVIEGKMVTALRPCVSRSKTARQLMDEYECRDLSKPVAKMDAEEVFNVAKGKKPSRRRASKTGLSQRMAYWSKMEKL